MKEILNYTILNLNSYTITVGDIIVVAAYWIIVLALLRIVKRGIYKTSRMDEAKKYSIFTLLRYFVYLISIVVSLQLLGFNLSLLIAGSAALLVGLGLGIQSLFSDYVSGIIILFDNTVKVGDVIEVNGTVCRVMEINLRTTLVRTRDDKYIILPNTELTKSHLINWTHNEKAARFDVKVGVDYDSDIRLVKRLLLEAASEQDGVLTQPAPTVRFEDHGDSALIFSLLFYTEKVFRVESTRSGLREKITEKFRANNVTIPFPQRVLHQAD